MTSVFLVLAHKNFEQLRMLIDRLLMSNAAVVVHLDSRAIIPPGFIEHFDRTRVICAPRRVRTDWGSFELVLATLVLLEEGIKHFPKARYFSLLSGQDYPIKTPVEIDAFFSKADTDFIVTVPIEQEQWKYGGLRRVNRYHWARNRKSFLGLVCRTIPLPPRRFPVAPDKMFVGSQWWSLRNQTVHRILSFVRNNPLIVEAFRRTYIPDEFFFHTVIKGFLGGIEITQDHLRYIEFFGLPRDLLRLKILNRSGIKELGMADLPKLESSAALFARKFDIAKDSEILRQLDRL